MNTTRIQQMTAFAAIVVIAACAAGDSTGPDPRDVATVSVNMEHVTFDYLTMSEEHGDTIQLIASLFDRHGRSISEKAVTWRLQQGDGGPLPDSFASLVVTGPLKATVISHRDGLVSIVASAPGADGSLRSGYINIAWGAPVR